MREVVRAWLMDPIRSFAVGDTVDVIDLRDQTVVRQSVTITNIEERLLPGQQTAGLYATLSCGFAVSLACLKHSVDTCSK